MGYEITSVKCDVLDEASVNNALSEEWMAKGKEPDFKMSD